MSGFDELEGRALVVFDGHCELCNRSVRWLLRRDQGDQLRFAASESERVAELLARHGLEAADAFEGPGTILVVWDAGGPAEQVLTRSDAVAALLLQLPGPWPAVGSILKLIPRPLRELGYRIVARWRYRIWGRLESCPLPTAAERGWFL